MRKLASVQQISSLTPIPGADFIVKAKIQGWNVVVGKDEFQVGDKCLFLETDSLCDPIIHPWASCLKDKGYKVKTIKLRKVLSQGLAITSETLKKYHNINIDNLNVGYDLTEILKIKKYEPIIYGSKINGFKLGNAGKPFPSHLLSKTDEIRIQSIPELLNELKNLPYYITTKIDGTSATFLIDPDTNEFLVCSRNLCRKQSVLYGWNQFKTKIKYYLSWGKQKDKLLRKLEEKENVYWYIAKKYNIEKILRNNKHIAIQGEIAGPQIQGNPLGLFDYEFFVFNIVDINTRQYVTNVEYIEYLCKEFGFTMVPVEEIGTSFNYSQDQLLQKAKGFYDNTKNFKEGIVVRIDTQLDKSPYEKLLSFKVLNNDFLLKEK